MLRVFKLQSPMSMGAWILVAFSGCAFLAVAATNLSSSVMDLRWCAGWLAGRSVGALTGLLLASYTGVLIGATAIPGLVYTSQISSGAFPYFGTWRIVGNP